MPWPEHVGVGTGDADDWESGRTLLSELGPEAGQADGLNLLVIGYSGLDQEVLRLLAECNNGVRSLLVINHDSEAAQETSSRIMEQVGSEAAGPGASNRGACSLPSAARMQLSSSPLNFFAAIARL